MAVHGKDYGEKPPTSFPRTLEIETTDSHIPSAPAATASLTEIQNRKEPSPVRPTFAPFRLIFQLEKTGGLHFAAIRYDVIEGTGTYFECWV
jgi:hypothetical protein